MVGVKRSAGNQLGAIKSVSLRKVEISVPSPLRRVTPYNLTSLVYFPPGRFLLNGFTRYHVTTSVRSASGSKSRASRASVPERRLAFLITFLISEIVSASPPFLWYTPQPGNKTNQNVKIDK